MLRAWLFVPGVVLLTSASSIRPHQTDEESLKTALDAVTRKQRSLDFSGRDYYSDLQNFKYRPNDGDNEETFPRLQNQDLEDTDEDLEFLPLENGQLENIGGGYQNYNDKRLERALLDYLESSSGQREVAPSSFRERERTGSQKRSLMVNDRAIGLSNEPDRDLAALLYKELQKSPPSYHNMVDVENRDYPMADTLQPYYERYLPDQSKLNPSSKFYDPTSSDPMSWGEIFGKPQPEVARIRGGKKLLMERASIEDEDSDEAGMNEYGNRDRDWMYTLPTERRNVNGRYPLGREYGAELKRYPLTKRSPKPLRNEKETSGVITDPKVAKDLGPLFGSQKPGGQHSKNNRTSDDKMEEKKDHDHSQDHDHSGQDHDHFGHDDDHSGQDHDHFGHDDDHSGQDHDHFGHDHDHSGQDHDHFGHVHDHSGQDHSHDHEKSTVGPSQTGLETAPSSLLSSSPASLVNSPKAPGQKELNSNGRGNNGAVVSKLLNKRADHVQLTKKSVDWSDYFGIDRRRKKAALFARPGTQDRDDEWMLQRYYKTMAENLKSPTSNDNDDDDDEDDDDADKENGEKRNKLDQMDTRLKNVKNLIVEDALKYGSDGNSQEAKDVVMARLAAAYSLEKMRRALNEFRSNIAAQRDLMRAAHANNETHHYRDGNAEKKKTSDNEKRAGHGIYEDEPHYQGRNYEGFDEGRACPALDGIVDRCPRLDGKLHAVQELCIMHQICLACDNEVGDCASMFNFRAEKICQDIAQDPRHCVHMVSYSARQPSPKVVASCHHADSCLRRSYRYRQRGIYYQNGWPPHVASLDPLQLAER